MVTYYVFVFEDREIRAVGFPLASAVLLAAGVVTQSQLVMTVVGFGLFVHFSWLAAEVFRNSLMFPIALSAIGGAIIYLAVKLQQYGPAIYAASERMLPDFAVLHTLLAKIPAATLPIYWTVPTFSVVQAYSQYALPAVASLAALCFLWSIIEKYVVEEDVRPDAHSYIHTHIFRQTDIHTYIRAYIATTQSAHLPCRSSQWMPSPSWWCALWRRSGPHRPTPRSMASVSSSLPGSPRVRLLFVA